MLLSKRILTTLWHDPCHGFCDRLLTLKNSSMLIVKLHCHTIHSIQRCIACRTLAPRISLCHTSSYAHECNCMVCKTLQCSAQNPFPTSGCHLSQVGTQQQYRQQHNTSKPPTNNTTYATRPQPTTQHCHHMRTPLCAGCTFHEQRGARPFPYTPTSRQQGYVTMRCHTEEQLLLPSLQQVHATACSCG